MRCQDQRVIEYCKRQIDAIFEPPYVSTVMHVSK